METLGQWAIGACAAAAVCSAVLMLAPNGAQEKILKITVSCFFLICTIMPAVKLLPNLNIDYAFPDTSNTVSQTGEAIDSQIENEIVHRLQIGASQLLEENDCHDFSVAMEISNEQGKISVSRINLTLHKDDINKAQGLATLFYNTYGCTPEISQRE